MKRLGTGKLIIIESSDNCQYDELFKSGLDAAETTEVLIVDPHIQTELQQFNLRNMFSTLEYRCKKLEIIWLFTNSNRTLQKSYYNNYTEKNDQRSIYQYIREKVWKGSALPTLKVSTSNRFAHDRSLTTNNGTHFHLGRGLDIFQDCSQNGSCNKKQPSSSRYKQIEHNPNCYAHQLNGEEGFLEKCKDFKNKFSEITVVKCYDFNSILEDYFNEEEIKYGRNPELNPGEKNWRTNCKPTNH